MTKMEEALRETLAALLDCSHGDEFSEYDEIIKRARKALAEPRAATRWEIVLSYKRNTVEGTPDETYTVIRVVNSLDYTPGQVLHKQDVEYIFASGGWEMTIQ